MGTGSGAEVPPHPTASSKGSPAAPAPFMARHRRSPAGGKIGHVHSPSQTNFQRSLRRNPTPTHHGPRLRPSSTGITDVAQAPSATSVFVLPNRHQGVGHPAGGDLPGARARRVGGGAEVAGSAFVILVTKLLREAGQVKNWAGPRSGRFPYNKKGVYPGGVRRGARLVGEAGAGVSLFPCSSS
jgi:hypothetical protein